MILNQVLAARYTELRLQLTNMLQGSLIVDIYIYIYIFVILFNVWVICCLLWVLPLSLYKDRLELDRLKRKCKHNISIDVAIQSENLNF